LTKLRIVSVVGARPNFMKVAPIVDAINQGRQAGRFARDVEHLLVHTGQHYDRTMSELFFEELGLPVPDINLGIGSGNHGEQTGRIMQEFERVLLDTRPSLVIVVGDVNSTMACAIDAKKLNIPIAHVEAGLRSRDMTMPEEINRIVTDAIADLLFTTDRLADQNLRSEGISAERIHFVGNVMIDTLLRQKDKAMARPFPLADFPSRDYVLVTLHRPGNVDNRDTLREIGEALVIAANTHPVVFPVHPRTRRRVAELGLSGLFSSERGIYLTDPLGYLDFLRLQAGAYAILTDSGGIQEESTILGVPCLTLRPNTERPITITSGTNTLVGNRREDIVSAFRGVNLARSSNKRIPELWDGNAAKRIVDVVADFLGPRHD